jgi:tripartite-type tricarboxylate transporter receptor subunit TctC
VPASPKRCAAAQAAWPSKTVRIIEPLPPGQAVDIFARLLAERLTDIWKQQVIVDNKGEGGGFPGTEAGKAAAPDDYTPLVIVAHPSFPASKVAELIELARKEPGKISRASAGPGTAQHLSMGCSGPWRRSTPSTSPTRARGWTRS